MTRRAKGFIQVPVVGVRAGTPDDVSYIFARTLADFRKSDLCREVPNALYYTYMHRALEHHLTRGLVRVAYQDAYQADGLTHGGNSRHILGFIIADVTDIGLIVHYVNVRRDNDTLGKIDRCWRGQGIAKKLVKGIMKEYDLKNVIYTMRSPMFRRNERFAHNIDSNKRIQYNPFLFFTLMPPGWETGILANINEDLKMEVNRAAFQ